MRTHASPPLPSLFATAPATTTLLLMLISPSFDCFDEECLRLPVVELDDPRMLRRRLLKRCATNARESGAQEYLLGELPDEERPRVAVPDRHQHELAAETLHVLVRNQEE